MEIYHRHYKGGEIIDAHDRDNVRECKLFEARLFRSDSVAGNKLDRLALGVQHDDEFGSRKMSFASQYLFMSAVSDSLGFGYRPVFDSMCFRFAVDTFAGDTLKPIRFNVYELTEAMLERGESTDSVKYLNYGRAYLHLRVPKSRKGYLHHIGDGAYGGDPCNSRLYPPTDVSGAR